MKYFITEIIFIGAVALIILIGKVCMIIQERKNENKDS